MIFGFSLLRFLMEISLFPFLLEITMKFPVPLQRSNWIAKLCFNWNGNAKLFEAKCSIANSYWRAEWPFRSHLQNPFDPKISISFASLSMLIAFLWPKSSLKILANDPPLKDRLKTHQKFGKRNKIKLSFAGRRIAIHRHDFLKVENSNEVANFTARGLSWKLMLTAHARKPLSKTSSAV